MTRIRLFHADCMDYLGSCAPGSIDSFVMDPPYLLSFMAHEWDREKDSIVLRPDFWDGCYRASAGGGSLRVFGSPKTYFRLLRRAVEAGYQIEGVRAWSYGEAMPKGVNISSQFDRLAGITRPIVGYKKGVGGDNLNDIVRGKEVRQTDEENSRGIGAYGVGAKQKAVWVPITSPVTEGAIKYAGWGTGLKCGWEPIMELRRGKPQHSLRSSVVILARKPPSEATIAQNLEKWGTGGLNIQRAKIRAEGVEGRWPANVILEHGPNCRVVDRVQVRVPINRWVDGAKPFGGGAGLPYTSHDNSFSVDQWECHCALGVSRDTSTWPYFFLQRNDPRQVWGHFKDLVVPEGDTLKISSDPSEPLQHALMIQADRVPPGFWEACWASLRPGGHLFAEVKSDPWGLFGEDLLKANFEVRDTFYILRESTDTYYVSKAKPTERRQLARARTNRSVEWEEEVEETEFKNTHATVKPVGVMRKVVRETGAKCVVDLFSGSYTTAVAAMLEGVSCDGVELDAGYVEIGEARLRASRQESWSALQTKIERHEKDTLGEKPQTEGNR